MRRDDDNATDATHYNQCRSLSPFVVGNDRRHHPNHESPLTPIATAAIATIVGNNSKQELVQRCLEGSIGYSARHSDAI
eukprot:724921-Pyramimonas_sp.AAC.1